MSSSRGGGDRRTMGIEWAYWSKKNSPAHATTTMSTMVDSSTQTMLPSLTPPILLTSVAGTPVYEPPASLTIRLPFNPDGGSDTATTQTPQWTAEPVALHPLYSELRASSEATANPSDEEDTPLPGEVKQEHTSSATSSTSTLLTPETRILIKPSLELRAMQSTQSTPGLCAKLSRYANNNNHSPTSSPELEVYIPTGATPAVYIPTGAPPRPVFEARSPLTPTEPASYGPSREDVESLLERQRVFEEGRIATERKNSSALGRLSSLGRELSGSIRRTLNIGTGKKGFEARVKVGEEGEEVYRKKSLVSRSKSLFGGNGDVERKKSVFHWKAGTGIPWKGRRANTLGGTRKVGGLEEVVQRGGERENEGGDGEGGQGGHVRYSWEEEVEE